jgi:selenide,water dikinase
MNAMKDPSPSGIRLTEWSTCGGCAAKLGAGALSELLSTIQTPKIEPLLVGLAPFDDAAVYRLTSRIALVSTIDFFPPLVDEPADFGAIAAANACSDIFAMGGEVRLAVNVAAFPEDFPSEIVVEILRAASETVCSVGGVIAGGHTIRNPEPIFGLAVQGVVHPKRIFRKSGARVGDAVVLSKPLGTGLITSGGTQSEISQAIVGMRQTNQLAAAVLRAAGSAVHAVTDVTGFGLAGHAWEIADRSQVVMKIETSSLPLYVGAERLAREGHRTGGGIKNRAYVRNLDGRVDEWLATIATDPETSGGLLAVVDPTSVRQLEASGSFSVIGTCQRGDPRVFLC